MERFYSIRNSLTASQNHLTRCQHFSFTDEDANELLNLLHFLKPLVDGINYCQKPGISPKTRNLGIFSSRRSSELFKFSFPLFVRAFFPICEMSWNCEIFKVRYLVYQKILNWWCNWKLHCGANLSIPVRYFCILKIYI